MEFLTNAWRLKMEYELDLVGCASSLFLLLPSFVLTTRNSARLLFSHEAVRPCHVLLSSTRR